MADSPMEDASISTPRIAKTSQFRSRAQTGTSSLVWTLPMMEENANPLSLAKAQTVRDDA